ncbi:hypothetical protein SEVIR_9G470401v4 [Setaria viridis]
MNSDESLECESNNAVAEAGFPLRLPRLHPRQEPVHLAEDAQEHEPGDQAVGRHADDAALRGHPADEVDRVAGHEHPAHGLQRGPRPRTEPLLAVDAAHHPRAEREDDGQRRLGQAPVLHRRAADDEGLHPAQARRALAGEARPPERLEPRVVGEHDGVQVEARVQHPGHRGRLQHRVPDVAVGLVPERQRRRLQQQQQCRAELREREHGVDPLPLGEREQHKGEQERARREQVLPLDAPDAGRRRAAAAVAPHKVEDGERERGEEAVRGEAALHADRPAPKSGASI